MGMTIPPTLGTVPPVPTTNSSSTTPGQTTTTDSSQQDAFSQFMARMVSNW